MQQLEIRALNTYYGESHILRDVDLTVNAGEMVCLIGRNGVGKTTSVSYTHLTLPTT